MVWLGGSQYECEGDVWNELVGLRLSEGKSVSKNGQTGNACGRSWLHSVVHTWRDRIIYEDNKKELRPIQFRKVTLTVGGSSVALHVELDNADNLSQWPFEVLQRTKIHCSPQNLTPVDPLYKRDVCKTADRTSTTCRQLFWFHNVFINWCQSLEKVFLFSWHHLNARCVGRRHQRDRSPCSGLLYEEVNPEAWKFFWLMHVAAPSRPKTWFVSRMCKNAGRG